MLAESSKQVVDSQPPGFGNLKARFQLGWRIHLSCSLPLLDLQRGKLYLRTLGEKKIVFPGEKSQPYRESQAESSILSAKWSG